MALKEGALAAKSEAHRRAYGEQADNLLRRSEGVILRWSAAFKVKFAPQSSHAISHKWQHSVYFVSGRLDMELEGFISC